MRRSATALAAALVMAGCDGTGGPAACVPPPGAGAEVRWLSPTGSDAGDGSCLAPWRTLEHASDRAAEGDTVVLRSGNYGDRGEFVELDDDGVAFVGHDPDDPPTVFGAVKVTGDRVALRQLRFKGPTGQVLEPSEDNPGGEEVQVAVEGDGVEISDSEVFGNDWHAGIYLSGAEDARILRNHVHDNGAFDRPDQDNLDHGIYFGSGSGLVAGNLVDRNYAHGIQLYPRASGVTVAYNTIVRNGQSGIIIAEDAADNLVVGNVIAFNRETSIRSSDLRGDGNRAVRNLVWANGSGNIGADVDNLVIEDTLEADPRLTDDFTLEKGSPAIDAGEPVDGAERDRRGVPRPQGGGFDLGAFERP